MTKVYPSPVRVGADTDVKGLAASILTRFEAGWEVVPVVAVGPYANNAAVKALAVLTEMRRRRGSSTAIHISFTTVGSRGDELVAMLYEVQ